MYGLTTSVQRNRCQLKETPAQKWRRIDFLHLHLTQKKDRHLGAIKPKSRPAVEALIVGSLAPVHRQHKVRTRSHK
jgi:hypothetical protein